MSNAAEVMFGKKKVEAMLAAFREADQDRDGRVVSSEIGNLLRSQGLTPTQKQVAQFVEEINGEGGSFVPERFLDLAVACGRNDARIGELVDFFTPFDPFGTGKIPVRVFRNLMENVGETFKRGEVDELVRDFAAHEMVDYKAMLFT